MFAGFGGGTSNSFFLIKYLVKKKIENKIKNIFEKKLGSDLGIFSFKQSFQKKLGCFMQYKKKYNLSFLLVYPNIKCSTKSIYSKVKEVDLDRMEIASVIETGDSTNPVFILSRSTRSIVMNGGAEPDSLKDSTIVAIDYRDELVPLADFTGSLYVGDNPNSALAINGLTILCKGIYDPNDLTTQTQSTLVTVNPWELLINTNTTLNGVYNAQNLISNDDETEYYFTAADGIYQMNTTGSSVSLIDPLVSDILYFLDEEYFVFTTDTTPPDVLNRNVLFVNDTQNDPSIVYKYNLDLNEFTDTIIFDANVRDVNFYQ